MTDAARDQDPLVSAAEALWDELTPSGVVESVGVRTDAREIVVYVRAARAAKRVPSEWLGFRVVIQVLGRMRPAS